MLESVNIKTNFYKAIHKIEISYKLLKNFLQV